MEPPPPPSPHVWENLWYTCIYVWVYKSVLFFKGVPHIEIQNKYFRVTAVAVRLTVTAVTWSFEQCQWSGQDVLWVWDQIFRSNAAIVLVFDAVMGLFSQIHIFVPQFIASYPNSCVRTSVHIFVPQFVCSYPNSYPLTPIQVFLPQFMCSYLSSYPPTPIHIFMPQFISSYPNSYLPISVLIKSVSFQLSLQPD
jgi:hypothetical protein